MLLLCYRLRKSLQICQAEHTFICSMLPPSGSNMHWLHPHPRVPLLNSSPKDALLSSPLILPPLPILRTFVITLFTHLETLHSDVLFSFQGCHCLPDLYLFFLGTQHLLMEYQDCLFVFTPMLVFIVILGEEIERKMRIGIKVSIALHYQNEL